jgi:putative exosortase-associated protein (TIGR04073 family)
MAAAAVVLVGLMAGCTGPSKKLGRGINNVTEFARMGEIRRSVEQTALWDGANTAYTTGVIKGFNRSMARTLVGAYEIVTFPIPGYDPVLKPGGPILHDASVDPVYPDSYKPRVLSDSTFQPDANLGFSGGDLAPFVPGSRFRIYDY